MWAWITCALTGTWGGLPIRFPTFTLNSPPDSTPSQASLHVAGSVHAIVRGLVMWPAKEITAISGLKSLSNTINHWLCPDRPVKPVYFLTLYKLFRDSCVIHYIDSLIHYTDSLHWYKHTAEVHSSFLERRVSIKIVNCERLFINRNVKAANKYHFG